jgi:secondary thiamine-phosphate synthase enzyme
MESLTIRTSKRDELIDITADVQSVVTKIKSKDGLCCVFVPHTTAGITINENADPSVRKDILYELNKLVPREDNYAHGEGNSAAHIKASMLGFSVSVFIEDGQLQLGTWQGIYFAEFDGPRSRKAWIKVT